MIKLLNNDIRSCVQVHRFYSEEIKYFGALGLNPTNATF